MKAVTCPYKPLYGYGGRMMSDACFCGADAAGRCIRCMAETCQSHVATRLLLREWGAYEAWTVGHNRRRPLTELDDRAASTIQALRIEVNDLWVCNDCLSMAEEASLATLAKSERPPLFASSGEPLANLIQGLHATVLNNYSSVEWNDALQCEINRGGGAAALCKRIGRSAYEDGVKFTYQWSVGFLRKERIQVATVGRIRYSMEPGNGAREDQMSTSFEEQVVVDQEGRWLTLPRNRFSNSAPSFTELALNEAFLHGVALDVARGNTVTTYDSTILQPVTRTADKPALAVIEAVRAGRELIEA